MTRILVIFQSDFQAFSWLEDSRSPRELLLAINTGRLRVGDEIYNTTAEQSACILPDMGVVVVTYEPPLVNLTPRLFQVLWHIADGKTGPELARELNIQPRTVYDHYARLKERFGVETIMEVLVLAREYGLI